jgi:fructosamine-3-kinase
MAYLTPTFRKRDVEAPAGFFAVEAAGLRWLAEAEQDGGIMTARVLQVDESEIVLERVTSQPSTPWAAAQLGHRLALTHARGADWFGQPPAGWSGRGFIGSLPLPLVTQPPQTTRTVKAPPRTPSGEGTPATGTRDTRDTRDTTSSWGRFYAEHRLLPYLRAARGRKAISQQDGRAVETVCQRLVDVNDLAGPPEPAARIHGDLWSGNVLWSPDGPVLIDPAAHGGHRETDLAMLDLFGLPHLDRVLAAYDETRPLAEGWRDRIGLHQLHPLLVHAVLFGGVYGSQAGRIATRYATGP